MTSAGGLQGECNARLLAWAAMLPAQNNHPVQPEDGGELVNPAAGHPPVRARCTASGSGLPKADTSSGEGCPGPAGRQGRQRLRVAQDGDVL